MHFNIILQYRPRYPNCSHPFGFYDYSIAYSSYFSRVFYIFCLCHPMGSPALPTRNKFQIAARTQAHRFLLPGTMRHFLCTGAMLLHQRQRYLTTFCCHTSYQCAWLRDFQLDKRKNLISDVQCTVSCVWKGCVINHYPLWCFGRDANTRKC
jgi:hypothetical protein